jgi:hypothetical protein
MNLIYVRAPALIVPEYENPGIRTEFGGHLKQDISPAGDGSSGKSQQYAYVVDESREIGTFRDG